jgi:hypothetical protein
LRGTSPTFSAIGVMTSFQAAFRMEALEFSSDWLASPLIST